MIEVDKEYVPWTYYGRHTLKFLRFLHEEAVKSIDGVTRDTLHGEIPFQSLPIRDLASTWAERKGINLTIEDVINEAGNSVIEIHEEGYEIEKPDYTFSMN